MKQFLDHILAFSNVASRYIDKFKTKYYNYDWTAATDSIYVYNSRIVRIGFAKFQNLFQLKAIDCRIILTKRIFSFSFTGDTSGHLCLLLMKLLGKVTLGLIIYSAFANFGYFHFDFCFHNVSERTELLELISLTHLFESLNN